MFASESPAPPTAARGTLGGRVAVVTGSARGIGFGIAETFAREGAHVVLCDLDEQALGVAAIQLKEQGGSALAVRANVAMAADVEQLIASTLAHFGRIDVLVNNAGGSAHTPNRIEDVSEVDYDKVMDWNVRGTFLCIKAALPSLKVSGGCIINMASMSGQMGWTQFSPQYSAAKGAIIAMTRNLAKHLGPDGIRVNAIAPGFIRSGERFDQIWASIDTRRTMEQLPLGRVGELAELADVALFLASDQSRYVSGTIINVDGGYLAA